MSIPRIPCVTLISNYLLMSIWVGSLKYISWNTTRILHTTYLKHLIVVLLLSCNSHPQNLHLFHKQTIGEQLCIFWIANNPSFLMQSNCTKKIIIFTNIMHSYIDTRTSLHQTQVKCKVITKDPLLTSMPISWQILHSPKHTTTMCSWHLCYLQVVALC